MLRDRIPAIACAALIGLSAPAIVLASGSATVSPQCQNFINEAWNINTSEVQLGNTVEKNAGETVVKSFGKRMIADHTKLNKELAKLAGTEKATLPKSLDKQDEDMIANLSRANGVDFDKQYISMMIQGHTKAIAAFETEEKDCPNTAVGKFAAKALPTLKEHLALAEKTGKEIGVPLAGSTPLNNATTPKAQPTATAAQPAANSLSSNSAAANSSAHHWWQFWNW